MGNERMCDLVLEGGVTSALIYTGLIARLSRHYRLKNLGGTSSGAVAAAAGAIAQRAKLQAPHAGAMHPAFKALRDFPVRLAETDARDRTVLFRLFQPQEATLRGYRIVAALLRAWEPGKRFAVPRAILAALGATVRNFLAAALLGAFPGLWYLAVTLPPILARTPANPVLDSLSVALAVLLAAAGGLLVAILWASVSTLRGLVTNNFGLCSGMEGAEKSDVLPLTLKLHELFNGLFGRKVADPPVIFAHLWGEAAARGGEREIDLQVITTALNLNRPFRLPNDPGTNPLRAFFYHPDEWKALFPASVMQWLDEHRRLPGEPLVHDKDGRPLVALPEPAYWPVLVAVRLSLSFPGLLSAVPMYVVEKPPRARGAAPAPGAPYFASKVYFSDGGLTSNCPVHLFDVALPGHPTFAVRLDALAAGEGGHRVCLPDDDREPGPGARPFESPFLLGLAFQFVFGLVDTARVWRDRLQRSLPGYRERIVVVGLKPDEGGLNLAMPRRTILSVAALGGRAAQRLHEAFGASRAVGPNAWDRHRWLRLRSTLAAAQDYVADVRVKASDTVDYHDLLGMHPSLEPRLVDPAANAQARALLAGLERVAGGDPQEPPRDLGQNVSQPAPRLHMSPPW